MAIDKRSISDRLAALGYGHRRDDCTAATQQHEVYVLATGEVVGRFTAHEAVERFLSKAAA
jgi:hypothetical protein